jgi:hypothetical protein
VVSGVHAKWLIGGILAFLGLLGCQPKAAVETDYGKRCNPGELMLCICAGGESTGFIPCGADRMTTECGGCEHPSNRGAAGSAAAPSAPGSFAGAPAAAGVAGAASPAGAASSPAAPPPAAGGCSAGEVCRVTTQGSMKFCSSDPAAQFPPACSVPGQACGTNSRGTCSSGAPAGVPTALYCVYPAC